MFTSFAKPFLFLGVLLFLGCTNSQSKNPAKTDLCKAQDPKALLALFPSLEKLEEQQKGPFELKTHTVFKLWAINDQGQESPWNTLEQDVTLSKDAHSQWHLFYQTAQPNKNQVSKGEALFAKGQFYRKVKDTPWIHRAEEALEKERLFTAHDETRALLDLLSYQIEISPCKETTLEGKIVSQIFFSKKDKVDEPKNKESLSSLKEHMQIHSLQGLMVFEKNTGVLIQVRLEVNFSSQKPPGLEKSSLALSSTSRAVRISISHQADLTVPKDSFQIFPPVEFQEAPKRDRTKPMDVLPLMPKTR